MKNISNSVLKKILEKVNININELSYYSSGKCSDLYYYKEGLVKILKWYVSTDDESDINSKFNDKIKYISYLNSKNFNCIRLNKIGDNYFKVIKADDCYYLVYEMELLLNTSNDYDRANVGEVLYNLHRLSKRYDKLCTNNSWIEEYTSVYSSCSNFDIKNRLKEYFDNINNLLITKDNYGIIHYDSNKNNYILSKDSIYMIDFDSMCNGFYLMDVANYLFSIYNIDFINGVFMEKDEFQMISTSILDKYGFDYNDIDILNIFINYRMVYIYSILMKCITDNEIKKKIENIIFNKKIVLK